MRTAKVLWSILFMAAILGLPVLQQPSDPVRQADYAAGSAAAVAHAQEAPPMGAKAEGATIQFHSPPLVTHPSSPFTVGHTTVVIKEGAKTFVSGQSSETLSGFTAPAVGPVAAKTTYIVADGQTLPFPTLVNQVKFNGVTIDANAIRGADGAANNNFLWDTANYPVTVPNAAISATADVVSTNGDCLTHVAQVLSVGPPDPLAGYVAAGVGLRNRGSASINVAGIPAGAFVHKAYLYHAIMNPTPPSTAISVNATVFNGTVVGSDNDPCWPPSEVIRAYRSDVTSVVTGNGAYTIAGYPTGLSDNTFPWDSFALPAAEGASLVVLYTPLPVAVDIKPQSCPNPKNITDRGVLPVAILGTASFDVNQVDPATVKLEGVSPLRWSLEDVAAPFLPFIGKTRATDCTTAGPDSFLDLSLKFDEQAIITALGPVVDGQVLVLELTGTLKPAYGSLAIVGEDVVVIIAK